MHAHVSLRQRVQGPLLAFALLAAPATAQAADVTVTSAKVAAGKLVIKGTTAAPRVRLRLEGQSGGDFNIVSKADRTFAFSVVYLPTDCVVTVEGLRSSSASSTEAVVSDCARGISPRGKWKASTSYSGNDLVAHRGSSWLAKRGSTNKAPAEGADWQLFAAGSGTGEPQASSSTESRVAAAAESARLAAPTGPAGGALAGTYPNPSIRQGAVATGKLAGGAVTGPKIRNGAVIASKLADGAVNSAKVLDESLAAADLGTDSVRAAEIAPDSVGASEIAAETVGSSEITDGTVSGADVRNESLTAADLASSSVGTQEIATNGVSASEVAANAIDFDEIVDFGLTNQDIGVLFAEVEAFGALANQCANCNVTSRRTAVGRYVVDFARNIKTTCTAVATLGFAYATNQVPGMITVSDAPDNVEAVFVNTKSANAADQNLAFRLAVIC